jgi:hypothetical protein
MLQGQRSEGQGAGQFGLLPHLLEVKHAALVGDCHDQQFVLVFVQLGLVNEVPVTLAQETDALVGTINDHRK